MILPATYHCLASVPEALFWLLVGVVWVVIQIVQRTKRSNLPPPPGPPPGVPAGRVRGEVRDLDDFLEEMFDRTRETVASAPAAPLRAAPSLREEPLPRVKPAKPLPHAIMRKQRQPLLKPLPRKPLPELAGNRRTVGEIRLPLKGGMSMPPLSALGNPGAGRRLHPLAAGLRRPRGRRQAALWREVFGPPRALQPM